MRTSLIALLWCGAATAAHPPLALYPENPRYFLFRGKPTVLVTSGEHYGAVINRDFDYRRYLKTLAAARLNLTRVFAGAYREASGNFKIAGNTLAPAAGRFLAPWAESGGKFDLSRWNPAYLRRLRDFMSEASRRGVVVELNLFCPYYQDSMWDLSPLNARNNVNGIGAVARTDALTLKDTRLLEAEDAMVGKIVAELRDFDNLYYEICNEPYFAGVTLEWQRHMARTIAAAETGLPRRHLISQNIANYSAAVTDPTPEVSIFNFHYARPPEAVGRNWKWNKPIGCNETGFDGSADATYRIQGWEFLMAGGALYNNLDYSFSAGHEDGTFRYPETQPGGGSAALRRQLRLLRDFFDGLPFPRMSPAAGAVRARPQDASVGVLAAAGRIYALYLHRGRVDKNRKPRYVVDGAARASRLGLELPAGRYIARWIDPRTGKTLRRDRFTHQGGTRTLESPVYSEDVAGRIERR